MPWAKGGCQCSLVLGTTFGKVNGVQRVEFMDKIIKTITRIRKIILRNMFIGRNVPSCTVSRAVDVIMMVSCPRSAVNGQPSSHRNPQRLDETSESCANVDRRASICGSNEGASV